MNYDCDCKILPVVMIVMGVFHLALFVPSHLYASPHVIMMLFVLKGSTKSFDVSTMVKPITCTILTCFHPFSCFSRTFFKAVQKLNLVDG